jgi:single-stranded DNA-specific DHH superfamily exonuclease
MEVSFLKSINNASKIFDKKISNLKNIAIFFDENVDGFCSAKVLSSILDKKKKEYEIFVKRREENIDEKILKYDFVIFLDVTLNKNELKVIKKLKDAMIIDDQKPSSITFKKFLVLNSYLLKTFLPSSSICYFFSQHIYSTNETIFFLMLGTKYDNFSVKSLEKKFFHFFSEKDLKYINALQYFIRKSKEKNILALLEKDVEKVKRKIKPNIKKVEKLSKKRKIEKGFTRIVANYIFEKEKKPVAIFSKDKTELTAISENISISYNPNWKFCEFFNKGVEILASKKELEKVKI